MKWSSTSWAWAALAGLPYVSAALTPESMLAANRYSGALPNPTGVCTRTNSMQLSRGFWELTSLTPLPPGIRPLHVVQLLMDHRQDLQRVEHPEPDYRRCGCLGTGI